MVQVFKIDAELLAKPYAAEIAAIKPTVSQLVDRYDLAGKSVLSIGAGIGLEEMAMLQSGVGSMTMLDSDESGTLSNFLPTVSTADGATTYFLGDITDEQSADLIPSVDVLYISGLTPDENHRDSALWYPPKWMQMLVRPRWPRRGQTLHPCVLDAMQRFIAPNGLFILQSYSGGVDVVRDRHYVDSWFTTLAGIGFALIEAYHFTAAPRTTLWIASRTGIAFESRPALTRFHGRSPLGTSGIKRFI